MPVLLNKECKVGSKLYVVVVIVETPKTACIVHELLLTCAHVAMIVID